MPEGPETHRTARRLARVLDGKPVDRIAIAFPHLARFEPRLTGRSVERVEARGKATLVHFDCGLSIYAHNQLYGKWTVVRGDREPRTPRSLRVELRTKTHGALLYSASDVDVLDAPGLATHPYLTRLGPDVCAPETSIADVRARLDDRRFVRRRLAALLLDQGFLAGLGNYLRSEILFVAGVRPDRRPIDLDDPTKDDLAVAIHTVTRRSLARAGITTDRELEASLRDAGWSRGARRHYVFGRSGRPCHRCRTPVVRLTAGSRRLYVCPTCQDAPDLVPDA